jgi:hypothetical protein
LTAGGFGRDADQVLAALESYLREVSELIEMIPSGLVRGAGRRAQEAAELIKADVKRDYRLRAHEKARLSDVEREYFYPCIMKTFIALQALRVNTSPGPPWKDALWNADHELSYGISELKRAIARSKGP